MQIHAGALALIRGPLIEPLSGLWTPDLDDHITHVETWERCTVREFQNIFMGPMEAWTWIPRVGDFIGPNARIASKLGTRFGINCHHNNWVAGYLCDGVYKTCNLSVAVPDPLIALLIALAEINGIPYELLHDALSLADKHADHKREYP